MTFFLLLIVVGFLGVRMTTAEDRQRFLQTGIATAQQMKAIALRKRPELEQFQQLLRARVRWLIVTPALAGLMLAIWFVAASGTGHNAEALVGWGASYGPRTTNGEWWRLVTALFVQPSLLHAIINALAIVQLGMILERFAGRATFVLAFLAAGLVAGIVSLSTQPVAVTLGASGAVFGLYGLTLAAIVLTPREIGAEEAVRIAFPMAAIRRLAPLAVVFLLFSMMSRAVPFMAELAGFAVGAVLGVALIRGVADITPPVQRVAIGWAAVFVAVIAAAWPLNGMADVRPEIARVVATEDRTAARYQTASDAMKKGKMTSDAVAHVIDDTITPELAEADARLKALKNVPREHQALVADAEEFLKLRQESWRLRAETLRKSHVIPARKTISADTADDASWRVRTEAQFRSTRAIAGRAEGAERSSLEVLGRLRPVS